MEDLNTETNQNEEAKLKEHIYIELPFSKAVIVQNALAEAKAALGILIRDSKAKDEQIMLKHWQGYLEDAEKASDIMHHQA